MGPGRILEVAQRRLYAGPVKRAVHRLGLQPVLKRAYWATVGSRTDPRTVEVAGARAELRVGSMAEYETIESAVVAERPLLEDLLSRLEPGDVFWDVGGHVGAFACLAGSLLPDGHVVAFEPYPPNADRLRENAARNDLDVTVMEVALADERGEAHLAIRTSDEPGTQEHSIVSGYGTSLATVGEVTVETVPGDDLVAEGVPRPTVVKIDVEGAGPAAVRGMTDALRDCRLVYAEPHDNATELRDLLDDLGFAVEPVELAGHRAGEPATLRARRT